MSISTLKAPKQNASTPAGARPDPQVTPGSTPTAQRGIKPAVPARFAHNAGPRK